MATISKQAVLDYAQNSTTYQGKSNDVNYASVVNYGSLEKVINPDGMVAEYYQNQIIKMKYHFEFTKPFASIDTITITDNAFGGSNPRLEMVGESKVWLTRPSDHMMFEITGCHPVFTGNQMIITGTSLLPATDAERIRIEFNIHIIRLGTVSEAFGVAPECDCNLIITSGQPAEEVEMTSLLSGERAVVAQPYVLGIALSGNPASESKIYDGNTVTFTLTLTGDQDPTRIPEGIVQTSSITGGATVINLNPEFEITNMSVAKDSAPDTTTFEYASNVVKVVSGQVATFTSIKTTGIVTATQYVITLTTTYHAS